MKKKTDIIAPKVHENIEPMDFSDLLSDKFMPYTYAVIEDRALPDARDGLKPSQRRILVTMDDLNLKSSGQTEKSAKIAGTASGNYHPHGESIVYPTMVRLAQDWIMRYPLVHPQGNFGSPDPSSSPAAMRYCVVGETLSVTNQGLLPIEKIKDTSLYSKKTDECKININVLSVEGIINRADKFFDCGLHPVSTIKTRHGYEITGTDNHPLLVMSYDPKTLRPILAWKLTQDISIGDWLVLDKNSDKLFPKKYLSLKQYHPIVKSRCQECQLPLVLDEDLASIMGAITAEGNTSSERCAFTNNCGDCAYAFLQSWERVFGAHTILVYFRKAQGWSVNDYASLECHYLHIQEFMHNIGLTPEKSLDKEVPFTILQSPKSVMAAYIRYLFEGDGSVENCNRNRAISLTSYSQKLVHQVQIMLLRFGILSKIYPDKKRGGFKLCITGANGLQLFNREIGFVSRDKKAKIQDILDANYKGSVNHIDCIPYLSEYVRARGKGKWITKNNFDRLSRIDDALPHLQKYLPPDVFQNVVEIVARNYGYTQVVDKIDAGEQKVYSLRVNSACHSFVANGFINHNTEAKLSKFGELLLQDLSEDVVPYQPNYNEKGREPKILTGAIPNLLLNGVSGIAVGVATNMPTHNLRELTSVIVAYIKNDKITTNEILKLMPGPDFPTGGVILGQDGIRSYYENGRGAIHLEGIYTIESGQKGTSKIFVSELPFGASPEKLLTQIKDLVESKRIEGIVDLKDMSHRSKGQLVFKVMIETGKNVNVNLVLNKILKHTCLRTTFNVNQTVMVDGIVHENTSLNTLLRVFVDHRKVVLTNKYNAELIKSQSRIHILDGLINITKHIRRVVELITESDSPEDAQQQLIKNKYVETEEQAKAVLSITLRQLTKLEANALIDEQNKLNDRILWLKEVIANPKKLEKVIIQEQESIAKTLGDDRRTKIGQSAEDISQEDLILEEQIFISLTKDGYLKRMPMDASKLQSRGGKGVIGAAKKDDDEMTDMYVASTHDILLFLTNKGFVYKKKGYELPLGTRTSKGSHIANILSLTANEYVTNMIPVSDMNHDKNILIITTKGMIKRSKLIDYETSLKTRGLPAIKLNDGDSLAYAELTDGNKDVFIVTKNGKAIRYPETTVRLMGRMTAGVRALNLVKGDVIAQMLILSPDDDANILVITEMGFGKRTESSKYRCLRGRFAKGVDTIDKIKLDRNGCIVGACTVQENDSIIILTVNGKIIQIPVEDIRTVSRTAMGVRMLKLDPKDKVISVTKIVNGGILVEPE